MNIASTVTGTLLAHRTLRLDKYIVGLGFAFCLGWAASTGTYSVPWLKYRNDALNQVDRAVAPTSSSKPLGTHALVTKAQSLNRDVKVAVRLGCLPEAEAK